MLKLGFPVCWINMVMLCVKSVSFATLAYGFPSTPFRLTRGLRQGDPLSHFLFLFCIERLSSLLQHAEEHGVICRV